MEQFGVERRDDAEEGVECINVCSMQLSALSNLSCCIKLTFKEEDVMPTLFADLKRLCLVAHLSQICDKISMNSSLLSV